MLPVGTRFPPDYWSCLVAHRLATAVTTRLLDDERVDGIGVSIGVCHSRPGQSLDDLVRCADTALLTAKRLGRGRVVVAE